MEGKNKVIQVCLENAIKMEVIVVLKIVECRYVSGLMKAVVILPEYCFILYLIGFKCCIPFVESYKKLRTQCR